MNIHASGFEDTRSLPSPRGGKWGLPVRKEFPRGLRERAQGIAAESQGPGCAPRGGARRGRGLSGRVGRLAAACALLFVAGVLAAGSAQAQVLISNIEGSDDSRVSLDSLDYAQRFTTGRHGAGYSLTSIELKLETGASLGFHYVSLRSGSADGTVAATFTYPSLYPNDKLNYTYSPASDVTLDPDTNYWMTIYGEISSTVSLRSTSDTDYDETPTAGFSMKGSYEYRSSGLGPFTDSQSTARIMFRVNGAAVNTAPTASDSTVTAYANTAYPFAASHFNFADTDMDDELGSVKVVTLPEAGELRLSGTALTMADLPQTVTKEQFDAGDLTFAPAADETGRNYATFRFKVNDGMADSAEYTMTISVTDRPVSASVIPDQIAIVGTAFSFQFADNVFAIPKSGSWTYSATQPGGTDLPSWLSFAASTRTFSGTPQSSDVGRARVRVKARDEDRGAASDIFDIVVGSKPSISGTARIGQTLTAITGSTGSFTHQWRRVDGTTEANISGASSSTYTLVAADLGKKVKVKVSFTVNSVSTEATSDAFPPHATIQPATSGTADLAGRRQVWEGTLTVGVHVAGGFAEVEGYGWSRLAGHLTRLDDAIGLGTNSYRIGGPVLLYAQTGDLVDLLVPPPGALVFGLIGSSEPRGSNGATQELTAAEKAALRLHVGDQNFDFSATTYLQQGGYEWQNANLVWAEGDSIPLKLSVPTSFMARVAADPPTVEDAPRVSGAGSDGTWSVSETVEVTLTFSESVAVDTTSGAPSVGILLGGTAARRAEYAGGSGTAGLVFGYTLVRDDGSQTLMGVAPNSLALNGGTIRSVATEADAVLRHEGKLALGSNSRSDGADVTFNGVPAGHDGGTAFKVSVQFGGEPSGLSAKRDAASVLEVTGGSVTKARQTAGGPNTVWEVTVVPAGAGDVTVRVPARACGEAHAVCIGVRPLSDAVEATVPGPDTPSQTPTARFNNVPASHDGVSAFAVELHLSAAPEGLTPTTVAGGLLNVTGGTVTGARQVTQGDSRAWEVTVTPSQMDDIEIGLPARACGEANAVCVGGQALAEAVKATVPGRYFTGRFTQAPEEHDGSSFLLHFEFSSEPKGFSYRTVQGGLFDVEGARIEKARRLERGRNLRWQLTIAADDEGDVTLAARETAECGLSHAACDAEGRKFAGGLSLTVLGPPVLSVADATVAEAGGATLDFVVRLSRGLEETVTVEYTTVDGSAMAGSDYTATSSRLTFARHEISKTVSVPVLDDVHNEGSETMRLTLQNPSPSRVRLADAEASGTISNDDPMPGAWIARFGRTVGSQVMEAVSGRLDGNPSSHLTVGGVGFGGNTPLAAETLAPQDWLAEELAEESDAQGPEERTLSGRDLLLGSSFHLVSQAAGHSGPALSAWGRIATGGFQADVDDVTLDGDVTTGFLGFDAEWERLLVGLLLSHSVGDGTYNLSGGGDRGTIESALTGVYPYARLRLNGRLSVWGLAGVGSGDLTLMRQDEVIDTGLGLRLGAIGIIGTLLEGGVLDLALKSDALWVRTDSDAATGLAAASAQVSRVRLILEGGRTLALSAASTLTPTLQVGLRHDGGDAETGTGVEVGAGLRYVTGMLTVEAQVRTLLAHEANGYEEWGASGAIRLSPHASGLGPSLAVMPAWGASSGGVARLWSPPGASSLVPGRAAPAAGRLDAELGYGLAALRGQGILTPYARVALVEGAGRSWHLGTRLSLASSLDLSLEGSRREHAGSAAAHDLALRATVPW